jgi:outer membrane receptor for ferrienterochelin and colicins
MHRLTGLLVTVLLSVSVTQALAQTAPDPTAPAQIAPDPTTPAQTSPEQIAPDPTTPAQTSPEPTAPIQTAPAPTAPEPTAPAQTAPETIAAESVPIEERAPTEEELDAIAKLSLEQLLDGATSVASKREERISDASATVTAYTARDLEALGYYSLYELADFTAGYSSTIMYGERVFETRGQKAGSFNNNKHLVYLNGIPINHARSYKAPADHELPLYFAERVEFLKGPASALYGTSAFFGVVNLVPKRLTSEGALVETRVSAGTRDHEMQLMNNALYTNSVGRAGISVGYYEKGASRDPIGLTNSALYRNWDDQKSLFVHASHELTASALKGLTLGVIYMRKDGGLGEYWGGDFSHELNDLTWETLIPYLKFERVINKRLSSSSYLEWNRGRERGASVALDAAGYTNYKGTGDVFDIYDARVNDIQGQTELRWNVHDHAAFSTEVVGGANVDTRKQLGRPDSSSYQILADAPNPYKVDAPFNRGLDRYNIYSAYMQLRQQLPVLAGLILTLGAREDYGVSPTQTYSQISPRAGFVQRLTSNLNLRAFYGTALRAPGAKEIGLNSEAKSALQSMHMSTSGIGDVSAETIRSVEGGPIWVSEHVVASATVFYNQTKDSLDGTTYEMQNIFVNTPGKTVAYGGEGELQVAPLRSLRLIANYAWAKAELRVPGPNVEVEDVPVQKLNGAVLYTGGAPIGLKASLAGKWVSSYRAAKGPNADGRFTVDLNVVKDLFAGFSIWAQVRNILNDKTKLPKGGKQDVPVPGTTLFVSLSHRLD